MVDQVFEVMAVAQNSELADLPDFLTVEEAARVLRLGRTQAYELTRVYRETSGRRGLAVLVFGRTLRVPKAAIVRLAAVSGDQPDSNDVA